MTNCVNCGAILKGNICEYCGTRYENGNISADFGQDDYFGELKICGNVYRVYLGNVEMNVVCDKDAGRDENGVLHPPKYDTKHKFVLIEV